MMKPYLCIAILFLLLYRSALSLVNLAKKRPAEMSSTYVHTVNPVAERAVDGDKNPVFEDGSCMHTGIGDKTAWWWVQLQYMSTLKKITIIYRKGYESRFAGFSIYVTNEPVGSSEFVKIPYVYRDIGPNLPSYNVSIDTNGTVTGRYVTVYNNRTTSPAIKGYSENATLELCEVEVYGCAVGKFGQACGLNCSQFCLDKLCDPDTGKCLQGCEAGYIGTYCNNTCGKGMFGSACSFKCNCRTGICNHETGICDTPGCQAGWFGGNCTFACKSPSFGPDCNNTCYCANGTCDRQNGKCEIPGCKKGYQGSSCSETCESPYFGPDCIEICHCANGTCERQNGVCQIPGCKDGYIGPSCNEACASPNFGQECNETCYCAQGTCEPQKGECRIPGCKAGYKGASCNRVCGFGEYGPDCRMACGTCQNETTCDVIDGTCPYGCADGFTGYNCNEVVGSQSSGDGRRVESTGNQLVDILVGVIVTFFIVLAAVLVFLWRRRKRTKAKLEKHLSESVKRSLSRKATRKPDNQEIAKDKEHVYCNAVEVYELNDVTEEEPEMDRQSDDGTLDLYGNISNVDIVIGELVNVVRENKKNNDCLFKQQYKSLPYGQHGVCEAGKQPQNNPKNRFKNILPYDENRVKLDDENGQASDYINANYVDGIDERGVYIASQAPKPSTLDDHWRMIWMESVDNIVMLTNINENGKAKCHKYWPELGKSLETRRFSVRHTQTKEYAFFTVRFLTVCHKRITEQRNVTLFHYTAWPDFGVPEALGIIQFHDYVTSHKTTSNAPLLVHCSAGIGRTGTYIGLDALLQQGRKTGRINVYDYVAAMRKCRMNMVQTQAQYIFLHDALLEGLRYVKHPFTKTQFTEELQQMRIEDKEASLRQQYQELETMKPRHNEVKSDSSQNITRKPTKKANSQPPVNKYSVCLKTEQDGWVTIPDALYLSTYNQENGIVVTKSPGTESMADLWTLVMYLRISNMLFIEVNQEEECLSSDTKKWLPRQSQSLTIGSFEIECVGENTVGKDVVKNRLKVKHEEFGHMDTSAIVMSQWSTESSVEVINILNRQHHSGKNQPPILMASHDGVSKCGVIAAAHSAIEQINMDDEADIFNIVRQMRVRNPAFIGSYEEYFACFISVEEYLKSQCIYENN